MVHSAQKNKKKSKHDAIHRLVARNKIISLFIATSALIFLGISLFHLFVERSDKNNVVLMRENVSALVGEMSEFGRTSVWQDEHTCAIIKPRSLGEETTHSCDVHYVHVRPIETQQDIDYLIADVNSVLISNADIVEELNDQSTGSVLISNEIDENSYYTATSFRLKDVRLDRGPCYVRYILSSDKKSVEVNLQCVVKTKKAYFEPVRVE
jgi:hypothetical protein